MLYENARRERERAIEKLLMFDLALVSGVCSTSLSDLLSLIISHVDACIVMNSSA